MESEIIYDYLYNYIGTMELSKKYNIHRWKIQKILKENNIKLRKKTPNYKINHHYFSKFTDDSCYWAGFILADGYIRNNNRNTLILKLQKDDSSHLNKFKLFTNYDGDVKIKDNYCIISVSSDKIVNDLCENFDITNNKSLTCYISDKIPLEFINSYIRGYFDGDGSITYTTTHTISFTGTYETVDYIRNYFNQHVGIKLKSKDMPDITKNGNVYVIFYSGKSAYNCLTHIYEDANIYLERKYKKYINLKYNYGR